MAWITFPLRSYMVRNGKVIRKISYWTRETSGRFICGSFAARFEPHVKYFDRRDANHLW